LRRHGLGRGLDALIPTGGAEPVETGVREIPVNQISPNRFQPRQRFDPAKLEELANSIREHGIVQPVVVRPLDDGFELVVGERRWRAAQQAGLRTVPAVVKDVGSDADVLEVALVENLQREDLNPLEEASAYQYLISEFGLTQEEVARRVGRSRPQVGNTLRLLHLDAEIQEEIQAGKLSMGHAKALLSLPDRPAQFQLFRKILAEGMSVREAEETARRTQEPREAGKVKPPGGGTFGAVEEQMRNVLGTRVTVRGDIGRGRVEIEYYSEDDLSRIVDLIAGAAKQ
jgi:ParB family chromosome partitioning protein